MPVDVVSEIEIARPRDEVADYACDPDTATEWYENIEAVEWKSARPLSVGTRSGTRMTLRNRGEPAGFSRLVAPLLAPAMRRATRKDLARLKQILESR